MCDPRFSPDLQPLRVQNYRARDGSQRRHVLLRSVRQPEDPGGSPGSTVADEIGDTPPLSSQASFRSGTEKMPVCASREKILLPANPQPPLSRIAYFIWLPGPLIACAAPDWATAV